MQRGAGGRERAASRARNDVSAAPLKAAAGIHYRIKAKPMGTMIYVSEWVLDDALFVDWGAWSLARSRTAAAAAAATHVIDRRLGGSRFGKRIKLRCVSLSA